MPFRAGHSHWDCLQAKLHVPVVRVYMGGANTMRKWHAGGIACFAHLWWWGGRVVNMDQSTYLEGVFASYNQYTYYLYTCICVWCMADTSDLLRTNPCTFKGWGFNLTLLNFTCWCPRCSTVRWWMLQFVEVFWIASPVPIVRIILDIVTTHCWKNCLKSRDTVRCFYAQNKSVILV